MTRHPGVESCSSGSHFDAGHQAKLAPFRKAVVGIANIVQEVKTGTDTADSDLTPWVQLSRAQTTQRSPLPLRLERAYRHPAASSRLRRGC